MNLKSNPYALTAIGLFNKSQSMTGFGNAVSALKSLEVISSFRDVDEAIEKIDCHTVEVGLYKIVQNLDLLREKAKKLAMISVYISIVFSDVCLTKKDLNSGMYMQLPRKHIMII